MACRNVRAQTEALAKAGSEVRYLSLDVTSKVELGEALENIRREWAKIFGLIHGAGVLQDRLISDKTPDRFEIHLSDQSSGSSKPAESAETGPTSHGLPVFSGSCFWK